MQMLTFTYLAAFASAASIQKRCSPAPDPDVHHGYVPPQPCWFSQGTACEPYIRAGTTLTIDSENNKVTIEGIPEFCVADIAEEHAREEDGRKTWGWTKKYGTMEVSGNVLEITGMSDETIEAFSKVPEESTRP